MSLEEEYIQYGVPSDWAKEYTKIPLSISAFRQTSQGHLFEKYHISKEQISFVKRCILRKPIDQTVVYKLLENNRFVCCICKGEKSNAFIIHHIIHYSLSRDNEYSNLAVVCPNDHDLIHREGIALTNKITVAQVKKAKKGWEAQVQKENKAKAINKPIRNQFTKWQNKFLFKELQSFTERDQDYFFGRSVEITELLTKVEKYSIVGLFGESGTGKTSLLNAGLIPNLKKEGFVTVSIRCFDEPVKRIREELLKTCKEIKVNSQLIDDMAATDTFARLIAKLKAIVEQEGLNIVIIIDQLEELFTRAREAEREHLSQGINEVLFSSAVKGKIYFILSLREDYIGELWDWAHLYRLEDAWVHQYRVKRFDDDKAFEAIIQPLLKLGITSNTKFIYQVILELKKIGNGLIYPPYLQIVCTELFEEYKRQVTSKKGAVAFGQNLYYPGDTAETLIADYLSESMLRDLTEQEKICAQNILDLLTGPEGLRTFLTQDSISRYLNITTETAYHVIEHLIKKKIVHPIVEEDKLIGYELVHDFYPKNFLTNWILSGKGLKPQLIYFRRHTASGNSTRF